MADPATYTEGDWSALTPAEMRSKLENIEHGIKANNDALVAETDAGRALTQAADAEAQRSALGLGDSATKNVGTGSGDVAAGNAPAAAQAAAEATAAGALAGHVAAADPHTQYAKEADLGDSATKNVGTGSGDVAAGNAPAGAVTTHESTYAHANLPTADEKTRLSDIQAASGATTALKLANLTSPASPTQQGVALLGASGGAAKLTKMPDGATAVFANDDWTDLTGVTFSVLSPPSGSVSNGEITITPSTTQGRMMITGAVAGKIIALRAKRPSTAAAGFKVWGYDGANLIGPPMLDIALGTSYQIFVLVVPIGATSVRIYPDNDAGSAPATIDWIWIGDYSYLDGSLSEEAARIANELGDTAGVGVAASGTITSNGTNVSAGDTVTINGKTYTFIDAEAIPANEGEVRISPVDANNTMIRLHYAINRYRPSSYDGAIYKIAAPHPSVYATRSTNTVNLFAGTASGTGETQTLTPAPGTLGNQITLAKSAATLTISGSTLTGGKDAVGDKIHTQLQTMPATTSKYGAALLAADGGTTAGTVVQANDSRLQINPATWTPVPKFGGNIDDGTYTISENYYTKSGKKVHCEAIITWTVKGTKTGNFLISGMPLTSRNSSAIPVGKCLFFLGASSLPGMITLTINSSGVYLMSQGAASASYITDANFTATTSLRISFDYIGA